jgi:hypothetical protein
MKKFPYWHQTSPASCGPSCLLMMFNFIKPEYGMSREKEWEIWRDSSLLAWRGSHPYGLAIASLKRGFSVDLYREKKTPWKDANFPENNEPLRYAISEQEKTAKLYGLSEEIVKKLDLPFLKSLVDRSVFPMLMIKSVNKNNSLGVLHWVILTKIDDKHVTINDPLFSAGRKVPLKIFMKAWDSVRSKKLNTSKEVLIVGV